MQTWRSLSECLLKQSEGCAVTWMSKKRPHPPCSAMAGHKHAPHLKKNSGEDLSQPWSGKLLFISSVDPLSKILHIEPATATGKSAS
jgi:hypothetical protein